MNNSHFSKIYPGLEKGRYFTTVWCTLDPSVIPFLQQNLEPLLPYCEWLSTFGDYHVDPKYLPHISLRYLGFTDELNKNNIEADLDKFKSALEGINLKKITLGGFKIWKKMHETKVQTAILNWQLNDSGALKEIHNLLLKIPGYQYFESLEGENYNPHISLGQIDLTNEDNLKKVEYIIENQNLPNQTVKLTNFAINYAKEGSREELPLLLS